MKSLMILLALLLSTAFITKAQSNFTPPENWKLVVACSAEFYIPQEFKEEKVQPIDSCIRKYKDENNVIMLDVLGYITPNASRKDEYSDEKEFNYRKTKVDKREAEIISYIKSEKRRNEDFIFASVLFVPQMTKEGGNLTIWINSKTVEERDKLLKIFQTVKFP